MSLIFFSSFQKADGSQIYRRGAQSLIRSGIAVWSFWRDSFESVKLCLAGQEMLQQFGAVTHWIAAWRETPVFGYVGGRVILTASKVA